MCKFLLYSWNFWSIKKYKQKSQFLCTKIVCLCSLTYLKVNRPQFRESQLFVLHLQVLYHWSLKKTCWENLFYWFEALTLSNWYVESQQVYYFNTAALFPVSQQRQKMSLRWLINILPSLIKGQELSED